MKRWLLLSWLSVLPFVFGCTPEKLPPRPPVADREVAAEQIVRLINSGSVNAVAEDFQDGVLCWREQVHIPELAWERLAISLSGLSAWTAKNAGSGVWRFEVRSKTLPDAARVPQGFRGVTSATFSILGRHDAADFAAALDGWISREALTGQYP